MRSVCTVAVIGAALLARGGAAPAQERSSGLPLLAALGEETILMRRATDGGRPMATLSNTEVRSLRPWFTGDEYDRADPRQRCFHGASLGALFGATVLLDATDTFSAYVLSSPA